MTPIDWLRKQVLAEPAHSWAEGCPAGLPVPGAERCAAADCESVPLTALAEGERGRVTCLEQPGSPAAMTLTALGALPGVDVELVQRNPAFVFRIGHTDLAVDEGLARCVRVRRA